MMAKSSIESPRVTRGSPRKRWLEARRKSMRGVLRFSLFDRIVNKHVTVVQRVLRSLQANCGSHCCT